MQRRSLLALGALAVAGFSAAPLPADAQTTLRRRGEEVLILNVRPRSYLDAGRVAPVGSTNFYAVASHRSYLTNRPYSNLGDRFGESVLPDPYGIMPGARNPFGPIDFVAPDALR